MARGYLLLDRSNDYKDSLGSRTTRQRAWIATCASIALTALLIAVAVIMGTIGTQHSAALATLRSMLEFVPGHGNPCKKFASLKKCFDVLKPLAAAAEDFGRFKPSIEKIVSGPSYQKTPPLHEFINDSLDACTCMKAGTCVNADNTIVTAIIDLKRGQWGGKRDSFLNYTEPLKRLIARYPKTPKVVFVQKGYGAEIAAVQPGGTLSPYLCLLEINLHDLPEYAFKKDWGEAMLAFFDKHHKVIWPQTVVPYYDILMASKVAVVGRAAKQNVFGSKRFAWVDGGLHVPMTDYLPREEDLDLLSCGNKVCIPFGVNPVCWQDEWSRTMKNNKANITLHCNHCELGATFTGTRESMLNLVAPFDNVVRSYLRDDVIDNDQGMFLFLYLNRPDVFHAAPCKTIRYCAGYMLGGHKLSNASEYEWGNCDDWGGTKPGVKWNMAWLK